MFPTAARSAGLSHEIARNFLAHSQRRRPLVQKQLLDTNQLLRLCQTLGRKELLHGSPVTDSPPANGTPVPPGYHLVYFTPSSFESELGRDGTDRTFNPSAPFTRRMWAGGEIVWFGDNVLRVGQTVTETTTVVKSEPKKTRDGADMIVVGVEKKFENENGTSLIDRR